MTGSSTLAVMATTYVRTADDDIVDALARIDQAQRMLRDWRAHLVAQREQPCAVLPWLIRRCKNITVNTIIDAGAFTQQACDRLAAGGHNGTIGPEGSLAHR